MEDRKNEAKAKAIPLETVRPFRSSLGEARAGSADLESDGLGGCEWDSNDVNESLFRMGPGGVDADVGVGAAGLDEERDGEDGDFVSEKQ